MNFVNGSDEWCLGGKIKWRIEKLSESIDWLMIFCPSEFMYFDSNIFSVENCWSSDQENESSEGFWMFCLPIGLRARLKWCVQNNGLELSDIMIYWSKLSELINSERYLKAFFEEISPQYAPTWQFKALWSF